MDEDIQNQTSIFFTMIPPSLCEKLANFGPLIMEI